VLTVPLLQNIQLLVEPLKRTSSVRGFTRLSAATMPDEQHAPGGYYSARNKIPTIRQFVDNLDRDKRHRDREIEEEQKAQAAAVANGDAVAHKNKQRANDNQKTVHDPTTGHQVTIDNVDKGYIEAARNPMVAPCIPV